MTPDERVEWLRNLRKGYGTPSVAVGYWSSLHNEDLIEVYAELLTAARSYLAAEEEMWSEGSGTDYGERIRDAKEVLAQLVSAKPFHRAKNG